MKKKQIIAKLKEYFSYYNLLNAIGKVRAVTAGNQGLDLLDAALEIDNDEDDTWFTALAVLILLDRKIAVMLLEEAMADAGPETISVQKQALLLEAIVQCCKLTKNYTGREGETSNSAIHEKKEALHTTVNYFKIKNVNICS